MNVSVVDLSANQKKLQVEIPAEKIQGEIEGKYRELAKHVRIKGFRPGKAPRSIIKSYYGKSVEMEVSSEVIKETFPEALRKTDLKPLVEADVSETHFEDNGSFTYTAILDVCPPFELEGYKGLKVPKQVAKVTEEQEEAELRRLREQHAQLKTLEVERPVAVGDVAVVDFVPWLGDTVFEKGRTTDFMAEIGKNTIHPDFDEKLIGRNIGESFSFELDYPEDAPTREIAGKTVRFEVEIKEIKEKIVPDLNDEFAKSAGDYETIDDLRRAVRDRLLKHEESKITAEARGRIVERLLEMVDFELSSKVVDREIDFMIANLLRQFESQGIKIDPSRFDTPEVRADYRGQAVRSLKQRLILQRIAQIEDINLTDEDRDEIYREIARLMRTDAESIRKDYAESPIVQQAEEDKIRDKVLRLLEDAAVYEEVPAAEPEKE